MIFNFLSWHFSDHGRKTHHRSNTLKMMILSHDLLGMFHTYHLNKQIFLKNIIRLIDMAAYLVYLKHWIFLFFLRRTRTLGNEQAKINPTDDG